MPMSTHRPKIALRAEAIRSPKQRKPVHLPNAEPKRRKTPAENGSTRVERRSPSQLKGPARAACVGRILFRRALGHETVARLHHHTTRGNAKDRAAKTTSRFSQTWAPLKTLLARATRNRSASLSASNRASLRPAEVNL